MSETTPLIKAALNLRVGVGFDVYDVSMFKILDEKTRYAFVSDEFKQTVEKNNLLGFKFKLVWDSENE